MSALTSPEFLKETGIAGVFAIILMYVFRDIIARNIFPKLTQDQAYKIINKIINFVMLMAVLALLIWSWIKLFPPLPPPPPPPPPPDTCHIVAIKSFNIAMGQYLKIAESKGGDKIENSLLMELKNIHDFKNYQQTSCEGRKQALKQADTQLDDVKKHYNFYPKL